MSSVVVYTIGVSLHSGYSKAWSIKVELVGEGRPPNVLLALAQARIATISDISTSTWKSSCHRRGSCHRRCCVSYPVYVRRYVRKTGGMDTSARCSHCQGCEPHILWTSDHIRTRPGWVELPDFSSVWEGLNFKSPPMWVEVTLPVYGGNLPGTVGTFSPKLLIWWSDFCQKCQEQERLWYHMAEARHHMWGQPIVPWGAEQSDSHGRNMWIS